VKRPTKRPQACQFARAIADAKRLTVFFQAFVIALREGLIEIEQVQTIGNEKGKS
jgi:hypothetical protein